MRYSPLIAALVLLASPGCKDRPELPVTAAGETNNVIAVGGTAYASLGALGLGIFDSDTGEQLGTVAPRDGGSIDDVAAADGLLFLLDAQSPGQLSVASLADPVAPVFIGDALDVPVAPFTGVSAGGGRVVVSGGTSLLTVHTYSADGTLGADTQSIDLGTGQPDVLVAADGAHAYVSTHFEGDDFGLTVIALDAVAVTGTLLVDCAGFTPGGAHPANFPIEAALAGDDTLLMAVGGGLVVIDVRDPAAPGLIRLMPVDVHPVNVDALGSRAAIVGSAPSPRLVILDITDPTTPSVVENRALSGPRPTSVALTADAFVIAQHTSGVAVQR